MKLRETDRHTEMIMKKKIWKREWRSNERENVRISMQFWKQFGNLFALLQQPDILWPVTMYLEMLKNEYGFYPATLVGNKIDSLDSVCPLCSCFIIVWKWKYADFGPIFIIPIAVWYTTHWWHNYSIPWGYYPSIKCNIFHKKMWKTEHKYVTTASLIR